MANLQHLTIGMEFLNIAEIHYFRLSEKDWDDRIQKAKKAGFNAIASYIPWLIHEEERGIYNFSGQYDVAGFIDKIAENGMYFIARPGPFVMAELKNEGIPYWIYEDKPHLVPVTWNSKRCESAILIFNHPDFLSEVERWYEKVSTILRPRLFKNGGNVLGIQLDNEIGMLHWVNNSPDLSDYTLERFIDWVMKVYEDKFRYGFEITKSQETFELLRNPKDDFVEKFIWDYTLFSRYDFANYVEKLRDIFIKNGIKTTFIINIHGTSGGRAHTFPVGISQLREAIKVEDVIPSTDIYLGDYTMKNVIDLWNVNEIIKCITEKPLGVMEFECGSGDYGNILGERIDPNASFHKAILSYIQGNRFLNYYLFSGGINPKLNKEPRDGNGRIAFTGEEHGFAAPIKPNGELDYTYRHIKLTNEVLSKIEKETNGDFRLLYDNICVAYIDEYYRIEYTYGKHFKRRSNIEIHRGYNFWDSFLKVIFTVGFRYKFFDIETFESAKYFRNDVFLIPTTQYMSSKLQKKVIDIIESNIKVVLYGDLPVFDEYGELCTLLIDYLKIQPGREFFSTSKFHLSVSSPQGLFKEYRTYWAREILLGDNSNRQIIKLAEVSQDRALCSVYLKNKAVVLITTECNANIELFAYTLDLLGARQRITIEGEYSDIIGTFPFLIKNGAKEFLTIINIDNYKKNVKIYADKIKLVEWILEPKEVVFEVVK
ncbi:beta-galactosidase [Fervidobacterium sp.]